MDSGKKMNRRWAAQRRNATWLYFLCVRTATLIALVGPSFLQADDRKPGSAPAGAPVPAPTTTTFELRIVGPDGKPVPDAKIDLQSTPKIQAQQIRRGKFLRPSRFGRSVQSDADGRIVFERPAQWDRLDIYVEIPGYAFYWAGWNPKANSEPIPAALTAKLEPAWTVGGVVVDSDGKPVPNAKVIFQIEFTKRPGHSQQLGIGDRRWTNNKGEWTFDSVPMSMGLVPVTISDPNYISARQNLGRTQFGVERGHSPIAKITLRTGLTVTGKVTDENGKPIAKALIRTKFLNDVRSAFTDRQGVYRLEGCEPGEARIVASAKGRARELQAVQISANMKPANVEMQPGRTIRVRVLDERGNPIPKAQIFFQSWRGRVEYFEFDGVPRIADDHGVWEWKEAPSDQLTADIVCPGEMTLDGRPLIARKEEYVFRVPHALVVSGKVIDAETKQPMKKFRVVPGIRFDGSRMIWDTNSGFTAIDGQYRLRETYEQPAYLIKIEAEGYLPAASREIKSDEGNVAVDFQLVKGKDVVGTVLTPDGVPAAGAKVALGVARSRVRIYQGEIDTRSTNCAQRDTDEAGHFHFGTENADFWLLITHPTGYAQLNGLPSSNPKVIKLNRWARVEGTFRVARKLQPHVDIRIDGRTYSGPNLAVIFMNYQQSTEPSGRFVFERVLPGRWRIGTFISMGGDEDATETTSAGTVTVDCPAGKTTQVEFGATGRPVIGQLQWSAGSKPDIPWRNAFINIRADEPGPLAPNPQFSANVDHNGNFCIHDVPTGRYVLDVRFIRMPGPQLVGHRLTVPAINEKLSQRPVDVGVLTLQPGAKP